MILPPSSPLLKQGVAVTNSGENVILQIGNTPITFHYEQALVLSRLIRSAAQQIRALKGGIRTVRSLAAVTEPEAYTPMATGQSIGIHVKEKMHVVNDNTVSINNSLVSVRISNHTFSTHYRNALKLSQWLRVRAKQARNTAGDIRHWSII